MHFLLWRALALLVIVSCSASAQYISQQSRVQQQSYGQQQGYNTYQQQQQQPQQYSQQYSNYGVNSAQYRQQQLQQQQQYYQQQANGQNGQATRQAVQTRFISAPVVTSNESLGVEMTVQLTGYSNPTMSLPKGKTCKCPTTSSCPYLITGMPTCLFTFTIVVAAPDQSVQYMTTEVVPVVNDSPVAGNWSLPFSFNMTSKPMAIDVIVHQLGVVIDQATSALELFDSLIVVDNFVINIANYPAAQSGGTASVAQVSSVGKTQGTTLQINYKARCLGSRLGIDCDLVCTASQSSSTRADCVSTVTGMQTSCGYSGSQVVDCTQCQYGLNANRTACQSAGVILMSSSGVAKGYRVGTIVLGVLLGLAVIFIILLVVLFFIARNRSAAAESRPAQVYTSNGYQSQAARPLIPKEDDEWSREPTRVTTVGLTKPPGTDAENSRISDDSFSRSNGGAAIARREAQV